MIGLRAIAVLEIKLGSIFRARANDFATEFFHEPGAQELFVQTQPGKRLHAERQQRFANVKSRKFFAFEDDYAPPRAREQRRGSAASRSSSDDRDIVRGGAHRVLMLANFRALGRDAALPFSGGRAGHSVRAVRHTARVELPALTICANVCTGE